MSQYTADFALVCEGLTDFVALENILIGYCKGQAREPLITQAQPLSDATGESTWRSYGGWEYVFRYLQEGLHRDALERNEYLVIQIDTDTSEHAHYGVPQSEAGQPLSPETMVYRVAARLRAILGPEDCATYGDRLIFAICVRELECWLLPLWENDAKAAKTTGCLPSLNAALKRLNQKPINPQAKNVRTYQDISRGYLKQKVLLAEGPRNPSLGIFLAELSTRTFTLTESD